MTKYMVLRVGVGGFYIHDVSGPFDTVDAARAWAHQCADDDIDDHHSYEVHEMDTAGMCPVERRGESFWSSSYRERPEPLYAVRKVAP